MINSENSNPYPRGYKNEKCAISYDNSEGDHGIVDIRSNRSLYYGFGTLPTFNNKGILRRTTSTGIATIGIVLNNTGLVEVMIGTLNTSNGFINSTEVVINTGSTLSMSGSNYTQTAGTTILMNLMNLKTLADGLPSISPYAVRLNLQQFLLLELQADDFSRQ